MVHDERWKSRGVETGDTELNQSRTIFRSDRG